MSKLVFPGAGAPYRGFIGEVRGWLQRIGSYHDKSPASATALRNQLQVLVIKLGGRILHSGVKVTAPAITGTYVNGYTFTIVNGAITAIVAS